mmetsp:Transcript_25125/g.52379  ORF Transcript_25125/g.52379 Transcript_25125/m.52379 type:complete len:99 (+) Transcript_25125:62-358(+)
MPYVFSYQLSAPFRVRVLQSKSPSCNWHGGIRTFSQSSSQHGLPPLLLFAPRLLPPSVSSLPSLSNLLRAHPFPTHEADDSAALCAQHPEHAPSSFFF